MWVNIAGREQKHSDRSRDKGGTAAIPIYISTASHGPWMSSPPVCPQLPSPNLRDSDYKSTIATFSPLSPRAPGAPISPWKTTDSTFNCKHEEFLLPSLGHVGVALVSAPPFGKPQWRATSFPPLAGGPRLPQPDPDQIRAVPEPIPPILHCGNAQRDDKLWNWGQR